MINLVDKIMAYESGELPEGEVIELFQNLIDSGMAWQLQGAYGRQAQRLIESGLCHRRVGNRPPARGRSPA